LDGRRARSSFPNATLCFVAEFSTVVAPERLTAARSPVPGYMATMASSVKPSVPAGIGYFRSYIKQNRMSNKAKQPIYSKI
jgi:hypothetical protein